LNTKIEKLDNKSPLPLYFQLKSYIEDQINTGVWEPGSQIPSELELSEQFQISRTTIRQAIGELVNERKLERVQGRGTFVSEISIDKQIERVSGFSQDMRTRGLVPTSDILIFEKVVAPVKTAKALRLNEGDPAILLKRLRKGNDRRIALEIVYVPYEKFQDLLSVNIGNDSLYEILAKKFAVWPKYSEQVIESIRCPKEEAALLGIENGAPVFLFHTTAYDQYDQPLEYTEGYYRGDRYILHLTNVINPTNTRS
jgi:GntR family transcriptional regulator